MNAGLLLVTHPGIASALLTQARLILDDPLEAVEVLELDASDSECRRRLDKALERADRGAGVLLLTDLPGATPANLAIHAAGATHRVVSGLSLPMLIRAWNYRSQPVADLARRAIEGACKAAVELP